MSSRTSKRPQPLRDIRYLESPGLPGEDSSSENAGTLYHVSPAMDAWARRLAALCRHRGVSLGQAHHLYVCFTPALRDREVRPTAYRTEQWQHYVLCGLPSRFNSLSEDVRAQHVRRATIEGLAQLLPEHRPVVDELAAIVNRSGDALELPLIEKATKKYRIVIGYTIPPWPNVSEVWLTLAEPATGRSGRCKLIETKYDDEARCLVGRVSLAAGEVVVLPRSSFDGDYCAREYNVSRFVVPIEKLLQGQKPIRPSRAYRSRR